MIAEDGLKPHVQVSIMCVTGLGSCSGFVCCARIAFLERWFWIIEIAEDGLKQHI